MNDGLKVQQFTTYPTAEAGRRSHPLVSSAKLEQVFDVTAPWVASAVSLTVFWLACFGA